MLSLQPNVGIAKGAFSLSEAWKIQLGFGMISLMPGSCRADSSARSVQQQQGFSRSRVKHRAIITAPEVMLNTTRQKLQISSSDDTAVHFADHLIIAEALVTCSASAPRLNWLATTFTSSSGHCYAALCKAPLFLLHGAFACRA